MHAAPELSWMGATPFFTTRVYLIIGQFAASFPTEIAFSRRRRAKIESSNLSKGIFHKQLKVKFKIFSLISIEPRGQHV